MSKPTASDVHVNQPLTNLSVAFMQSAGGFVADQVFPIVPVQHRSDIYYTIKREDWFRDDMKVRAAGTESAGGGYDLDSSASYTCDVWALHKDVPDNVRDNADPAADPDRGATNYLSQKALIRKEKTWTTTFFKTSVWTGGAGGATDQAGVSGGPGPNQFKQWDQSGSTPIADITNQIAQIAEKTGMRPNKVVLGAKVYQALKSNADIMDRIKYTQRGVLTLELLAALLDLDQVLVCWGTENTAVEGATGTFSFIAGKHALLVYAAPAPGLETATAGYTFAWNAAYGASAYGSRISRFRMEHLKSDRVELEMAFAQKVVASDLGCFFNGAVA